ncbi:hypothetical protein C7271_20510 [filamentous cyanobacterium CCP5]|nr:hypothetical protein C7271_20510 [filamentous cyanobacterium CCP5]
MPTHIRSAAGGAIASLIVLGVGSPKPGLAADFPPCPPPAANEYLLLVRGESTEDRTRIQDLLPSSSTVLVCNYLDDTVVRGGGFTDLETANAWAQYMTEVEQLQAFVARPAVAPATPATPQPPAAATPAPPQETSTAASPESTPEPTARFDPRSLGSGFTVLVNYQDQPDIALAVQEQVGQAIGLAVYRQRPYLLIAHSSNIEGAATTLQVLAQRNISGFIVNGQEVVMLTPAIATSF